MNLTCWKYICSCYKVQHDVVDVADTDKDGRVTLNEFHAYHVKTYGKPPSNEQWFKFHMADRNNDGFVNKADVVAFENHTKLFSA